MNKTFTIALVIVGVIVLGVLIFGGGMMVGRANWVTNGNNPTNRMGWAANGENPGASMMANGYNMMGGNGMTLAPAPRAGVGGYQSNNSAKVQPITVDQAKQAVEGYVKGLNNPDLVLKEVMIFDNNAYARITEKSSGMGAMELLVDPVSLAVFPEYGPNMMWNLKYGLTLAPAPRAGVNERNGMMGGNNRNPGSVSATMTVTSDQALKITQQVLDQQFPGYQAAADTDPFYGYYTIDIMKDGKPTGMLSVNGFSGQVFLHTWHGTFIEISE